MQFYRLILLLLMLLATACQGGTMPGPILSPDPAPSAASPHLSPWETEDTYSIVLSDYVLAPDGKSYNRGSNLHVARLSGREQRPLTYFPASDPNQGVYEFDVSHDGKQIAFFAGSGEGSGIHVMSTEGSVPVRIVQTDIWRLSWGLSWSPDGRRIAFLQFLDKPENSRGGNPRIVTVVNSDGSGLRHLTRRIWTTWPVWFPDSMQVAYVQGTPLAMPFPPPTYVVSIDGGEPRLLQSGLSLVSWSPDGGKMLWHDRSRRPEGLPNVGPTQRSMLWISGPDGSDMRSLTVEEEWVEDPAWAPDSRSIAYRLTMATPEGVMNSEQVWRINVDSGEKQALASFPWRPMQRLEWTRDGKAIYLLVGRDSAYVYDLWAVSSAGGEPIKILDAIADFRLIPGGQ